jgi:hypothetical protein
MKNVIKYKDFYLTAICIANGAKLLGLEKTSDKYVNFVLNISPKEIEEIISKHWNRELQIPTRDVIEAINQLKTRLHSNV